jgi:hypothetical protein
VAAGSRGYVTTVWRATGSSPSGEQLIRLVKPDGGAAALWTAPLVAAPAGTVRRVQLARPIGARWRPGTYRLELAVRGPDGALDRWSSGFDWLALGPMRVSPGATPPTASPPAQAVDALFGGTIRLRGYTIAPAPFAVTLHWQSERASEIDQAVFVHLVDAAGVIRAQSDGPPADGSSPTDGWSVGDQVDDRRTFAAPAGQYRLLVGLYDPNGGARLPASGTSARGDHADLGMVTVGG